MTGTGEVEQPGMTDVHVRASPLTPIHEAQALAHIQPRRRLMDTKQKSIIGIVIVILSMLLFFGGKTIKNR
jgi:hypothetical protein